MDLAGIELDESLDEKKSATKEAQLPDDHMSKPSPSNPRATTQIPPPIAWTVNKAGSPPKAWTPTIPFDPTISGTDITFSSVNSDGDYEDVNYSEGGSDLDGYPLKEDAVYNITEEDGFQSVPIEGYRSDQIIEGYRLDQIIEGYRLDQITRGETDKEADN
ncbi:hypothetical protein PSHT_04747 [Puccinia striiformis]|uniref:Uncharacterized protein n=1 Tax=Puccinia striiformis TaxID=27350 RepID=A0A2S4WC79_9BASI|nr:hypothetical protein PSHT_04747 [Puccinia striiformis]